MKVMCDHLAISEFTYIDGEVYGLVSNSADDLDFDADHYGLFLPDQKMQSGRYPFLFNNVLDHRESVYDDNCLGCGDLCCTMNYDDLDIYNRDKSCAIWVPSCYFVWKDFYIMVQPELQYSEDHHITYELQVDQTRDYVLLQPNHNSVNSFDNDNWDYDFFYSISAEPESMRWRVVVTEGEGVLVTVRNHRCPRQATWAKTVWCDAAYFDRPWMCDIEIPTMSAHPGTKHFFLSVYGKNATYSLGNWVGRENCHAFVGSGRNDGLDFCAGLLPYAVWRWDNYINLDNEANCFFEELYLHFRCQGCWQGVTPECNATLQAYACYESFHRCDEFGFAVPTCRQACDSVVQECFNTFDAVDLEHYNCSSPRYGDGYSETCSMSDVLLTESIEEMFAMEHPELLDFVSSPIHDLSHYTQFSSNSAASSLKSNSIITLMMVLCLFVFLFQMIQKKFIILLIFQQKLYQSQKKKKKKKEGTKNVESKQLQQQFQLLILELSI
eukprot:TRINITY_DN7209_c0_g1_i3.p1 TRINITY_DN7209_c0_g1~~TRINITY_DN7209_c0_g1_i3.p1  ORF type:complete len:561 (+),score=42.50 TRINITY_DN7209_c0_g1_i3:197-1684(+)